MQLGGVKARMRKGHRQEEEKNSPTGIWLSRLQWGGLRGTAIAINEGRGSEQRGQGMNHLRRLRLKEASGRGDRELSESAEVFAERASEGDPAGYVLEILANV